MEGGGGGGRGGEVILEEECMEPQLLSVQGMEK